MHTSARFAFAALLVGPVLLPLSAHAQKITEVALFRNQFYTQTDPNTVPINSVNASFDARLFTQNSGDVGVNQVTPGSVTLTYPDGSGGFVSPPANLDNTNTDNNLMGTPPSGTVSLYTSFDTYDGQPGDPPLLITGTDVDNAFPAGDYTVNYSGGTLPAGSVTVNYAGPPDPYSNVPAFDPASFTALTGLDSTQSHTLNFTPDVPSGDHAVNEHLFYFSVFDVNSNALVYSSNSDMATNPTTSVTLPGGVLMPGTQYKAELDFSERISAFSPATSYPNGVFSEQGFDQRTDAFFTTAPPAVPEASTTVSFGLLLMLGLGGIVIAKKRKQTA